MHLSCILYNLMLRNSDLFFSKRSRTKQSLFIQTTDNSSLCLSVCLSVFDAGKPVWFLHRLWQLSRIINYIWPKTYCISTTVYHLCFVTFLWNTASKKIIYIISVRDGLSFTLLRFMDVYSCKTLSSCTHTHIVTFHTTWTHTHLSLYSQ